MDKGTKLAWVAVNVFRIVLISTCLYKYDIDLTSGTVHDLVGLIVFALILVSLYFVWWFINWVLTGKLKPLSGGASA